MWFKVNSAASSKQQAASSSHPQATWWRTQADWATRHTVLVVAVIRVHTRVSSYASQSQHKHRPTGSAAMHILPNRQTSYCLPACLPAGVHYVGKVLHVSGSFTYSLSVCPLLCNCCCERVKWLYCWHVLRTHTHQQHKHTYLRVCKCRGTHQVAKLVGLLGGSWLVTSVGRSGSVNFSAMSCMTLQCV